jgi:hypothetical protein
MGEGSCFGPDRVRKSARVALGGRGIGSITRLVIARASRKQTTAAQRLQRQGDSERQFLEVCGLIATLSHPRGLVTTPRDMGMTADIRAVP